MRKNWRVNHVVGALLLLVCAIAVAPGVQAQGNAKQLFFDAFELMKAGKPNEAAVKFEEGLKEDPNNALAHYFLGEVFISMGQRDKAKSEFTKTLDLDRNGPVAADAKKALEKILEKSAEVPAAAPTRISERDLALLTHLKIIVGRFAARHRYVISCIEGWDNEFKFFKESDEAIRNENRKCMSRYDPESPQYSQCGEEARKKVSRLIAKQQATRRFLKVADDLRNATERDYIVRRAMNRINDLETGRSFQDVEVVNVQGIYNDAHARAFEKDSPSYEWSEASCTEEVMKKWAAEARNPNTY